MFFCKSVIANRNFVLFQPDSSSPLNGRYGFSCKTLTISHVDNVQTFMRTVNTKGSTVNDVTILVGFTGLKCIDGNCQGPKVLGP